MSIENITIDVTWFECSVSFPSKIYYAKKKERKKENIAKNTRKKEIDARLRLRIDNWKRCRTENTGTKAKTMTLRFSFHLSTMLINNDHADYTTAKEKKKKKTPRTNGFGESFRHRFLDTTTIGSRCIFVVN